MLAEALQAEVDAYCARFADERDENGRRLVVRNGYHEPREVTTGAGAVAVHAPRVNDKRIDPETGDAATVLVGDPAAVGAQDPADRGGAAAAVPARALVGGFRARAGAVPRLDQGPVSGDDHEDDRDLAGRAEGLRAAGPVRRRLRVRMGRRHPRQRALGEGQAVPAGADRGACGTAARNSSPSTDGYREATELRGQDLLRDAKRRGMRAPVLAIGDGALGFWGALREVFPDTREQRCWFHKIANVLAALPKSAHPGAKKALAEIWNAEDKRHALDAVKTFEAAYGAKFPKAVAKITDDVEQLLAFYDFPAEHWVHLRTTNPIESTFATVRNRSKITKGPGSRAAGIAMAYKLIEAAQSRWRAVNAPHLVALVRAGARSSRTANSSNAPTTKRPEKEAA